MAGSGTVTSAPSGITCGSTCSANFTSGTSVTLTATPSTGYTFSGWSGVCSGTSTCTVTVSAAQSVTATFAATTATAMLSTLAISGGSTQLTSGSSLILTTTANYSDGSSKLVSPAWSSSSSAVTVTVTPGIAAGTVTGNTVSVDTPVFITATYTEGGITKTAMFNVTVKAPVTQAVLLSMLTAPSGLGGTTRRGNWVTVRPATGQHRYRWQASPM